MGRALSEASPGHALARFVQRRERGLIAAWLAGCAALLALLAVWGIGMNGAERAVDAWDEGWVRELARLEQVARDGRYEEAASALERLDANCPAQFVKHRQDRERERLLGVLGECYVKLGKHKRATETLTRLVAFDPRNYDNHFRLAEAERGFGDTPAALAAYEQVLALHPSHLPSVSAVVDIAYDGGRFAPIVEAYERYLDAWLLARVRVSCGERSVELDVPVDGRTHDVEGLFELPDGWSGTLSVETRGYSARIESVELTPALRVGVVARLGPLELVPDDTWTVANSARLAPNELAATTTASSLSSPSLQLPHGAARLRVKLALFKALPDELWTQVHKSYRNRLELVRLPAALERSRVGGCLEAGSLFAD